MVIKPPLNMESQAYRWAVAIALAWLLVACSNDPTPDLVFSSPILPFGTAVMADSIEIYL